MIYTRTSIFVLLLIGVASSYPNNADEDSNSLRPFVSNSQKRRICVELCLSGLGGPPCGDVCADITPMDLPVQSTLSNSSSRKDVENITRDSACTVLCSNDLGRPLCVCDETSTKIVEEANFLQICSFYCINYDYQISGCQKCSLYKMTQMPNHSGRFSMFFTKFETTVDWQTWCLTQCSKGNGGAACNCDRLPMKK